MEGIKILVLLMFGLIVTNSDYAVPPPNLGDVRLLNPTVDRANNKVYGEAQVYFSDGGLSPPEWSFICADHFLNGEATVFCKQLGYLKGESQSVPPSNDAGNYPTWLQSFKCVNQYSHILHCDHSFKQNSTACQGSQRIVKITCTNPILQNKSSIYPGQVMLCPPDSMNDFQQYPNVSTSFGIVAVFFYEKWGGIEVRDMDNPSQEITHYRGNLICQEMGYQQMVPGSIRSLSSVREFSSYTFKGCIDGNGGPLITQAWIKSNDLFCKAGVYDGCLSTTDDPCFGCCYNYPDSSETNDIDYIIIQCMYNSYVEGNVPYGNKSTCTFASDAKPDDKMKNYKSVCAAGKKESGLSAGGVVGIIFLMLFLTLLLFIVLFLVFFTWKYLNKKRQNAYDHIGNEVQDQNNNLNNNH